MAEIITVGRLSVNFMNFTICYEIKKFTLNCKFYFFDFPASEIYSPQKRTTYIIQLLLGKLRMKKNCCLDYNDVGIRETCERQSLNLLQEG